MSARSKTVPPGKKVIVTNNGTRDIQVWTGDPPKKYCSLGPGQSDQILNNSNSEDLPVTFQDNGSIEIEIKDFDDC
jgi:hypothetical protein